MPEILIEPETEEEEAVDLPWNVVVHNDPVNLMSYVTQVFQKVFEYPRERAERHMLEVHRHGRSIVWTGGLERAELYVQQLHGWLLLHRVGVLRGGRVQDRGVRDGLAGPRARLGRLARWRVCARVVFETSVWLGG